MKKIIFLFVFTIFTVININMLFASNIPGTPEYIIATKYFYGNDGYIKDYQKAFEFYKKSAELGNIPAMSDVGFMYLKGIGVAQDYNKSIAWFKQASNYDYYIAMNYLADIYLNGLGVEIDYEEAVRWLKKASDLGDNNAMNTIGYLYLTSARDYDNAIIWLKKSADLGNSDSMTNLGYIYLNLNNKNEAIKWFQLASNLGDIYAEKELNKLN